MQKIQKGRYRHYKGNEYIVLGLARHSETLEELVVYISALNEDEIWVRPAGMFQDQVLTAEGQLPRFKYIGKAL